jgi:penicillin amidase
MRWVAQDVSDEFGALLGMARASDLAGFTAAVAGFRSPEQSVVYADTAGNIAYFLAGHVPLRRGLHRAAGRGPGRGGEARAGDEPQVGWTAAGKWQRYLTAAELPHFANPPDHFIATANNRVIGGEYPFFLSRDWEPPYRAQRIRDMLWRDTAATVRAVARQQLDVVDLFCRSIAPRAAQAARSAGRGDLADRLAAWDGTMAADRTEPTLVWSWYRAFERRTYAAVSPEYRPAAPLHRWLAQGRSPWGDLSGIERAALEQVLPGAAATPWGRAHYTIQRHPLGAVPVLRLLVGFDIGPEPSAGGNYTVNAATSDDSVAPFESTWGPSLRHVVDLGGVDGGGGFILPTGQSGHPFSPHYRDQTERWRRGELWLLPLDLKRIGVAARLVLVPDRR